MSIGTILLIILVLLVIGAFPAWPYSGGWGYYPSGIGGVVVIILIILLLDGQVYTAPSLARAFRTVASSNRESLEY